jgi:hypothetical protein
MNCVCPFVSFCCLSVHSSLSFLILSSRHSCCTGGWAGLLNHGRKMAAGATVIRNGVISMMVAGGSVT